MERYSKFKDPLTGINPFIQLNPKRITIKTIILAFLRLPIYFMWLLGFPTIKFLISIKRKDKNIPKGLIHCNSATIFDSAILSTAFDIKKTNILGNRTIVKFPEGASSNNRSILKYIQSDCDWSVGLKYSDECIYLYGNRYLWLLRFLGSYNTVDIGTCKGSDLCKASGLPQSSLSKDDKIRFLSLHAKDFGLEQ